MTISKTTQRTKPKQPKFEGFPYKYYTVGLTHAGRAAIEAEIAHLHIVPQSLHAKECTTADLVTAADCVIALATRHYQRNGMPQCVAGYFDVTLHNGVRLNIHIDQRDRLLSCWVACEADDGKLPAVHLDDRHCSADIIGKHRS